MDVQESILCQMEEAAGAYNRRDKHGSGVTSLALSFFARALQLHPVAVALEQLMRSIRRSFSIGWRPPSGFGVLGEVFDVSH
jgi:hypothetical protein